MKMTSHSISIILCEMVAVGPINYGKSLIHSQFTQKTEH